MSRSTGGSALDRSFEEVFRAAYWPLVRALTVAGGNREVAADSVQEAFTQAYARWSRLARYDDPVAWVRRVALHRLIDHERRRARGTRAVERLGPPSVDHLPEPAAFSLTEALDALPRQQRIAASLYYVEQLSIAEVAYAMELSEGAVKY
ncbi:MAG TPA: sigma-70 family RNA polymerase sigma factor, partial [Acidimicrobiia bacterium]|nr:sigma-70 family RNA polymerase sigma factor [Acidimicrobiia bacterium]